MIGQPQAERRAAAAQEQRQVRVRAPIQDQRQAARPERGRELLGGRRTATQIWRACSIESISSWMPLSGERCFAAISRSTDPGSGSAATP